ncbi:hypothetical protein [Pseudomonas putida]|jgi:hypothetical protein|uniref:hypothetical protein n=1 Tax=Pseudomonas putida TaxID=303 RepID=UPI0009A1B059|nr:hypothetical protein [Pseudomonas putida]
MVFGAIFSVVSNIGSAIASGISTISKIGSAVSSFATTIAPVVANVFDAIKPIAAVVSKIANGLLQALGIIKPQDEVADLGERAMQAAEQDITLDKFEDFEDYLDALRNFELDPEVSEKRSDAVKLVAGLSIGTVGLENKFNLERGSLNDIWLLPISNPTYFTPERMQSLIVGGRLSGNVLAYLENRLSGGDARSFEKKLETTPNGTTLSEGERGSLYGALDSAQDKWAELAKQLENRGQGEERR